MPLLTWMLDHPEAPFRNYGNLDFPALKGLNMIARGQSREVPRSA